MLHRQSVRSGNAHPCLNRGMDMVFRVNWDIPNAYTYQAPHAEAFMVGLLDQQGRSLQHFVSKGSRIILQLNKDAHHIQ